MEQFNLSFDSPLHIRVDGGLYPILHYLPKCNSSFIKSLRSKNIMFLDQILSLDGTFLLNWKDIQSVCSNNFKGPIPKWYSYILTEHCYPNHRLTMDLKSFPSVTPSHFNPYKFSYSSP